MGRDELIAYGFGFCHEIPISPLPESMKKQWGAKVEAVVKGISLPTCTPAEVDSARRLIKSALKAVNKSVDDSFWDIWVKKFIAMWYVIPLVFLMFLLFNSPMDFKPLPIRVIVLLGAIGGLLSGILTGEREAIPKGHLWSHLLYYSLVRPAVGVLAAIITFWMIESRFLISVTPTLDERTAIISPISDETTRSRQLNTSGNTGTQMANSLPVGTTFERNQVTSEDSINVARLTLKAKDGKQHLLYMLLLIFAGFSGDKLLKSVADKVTSRLIANAEKTKEQMT